MPKANGYTGKYLKCPNGCGRRLKNHSGGVGQHLKSCKKLNRMRKPRKVRIAEPALVDVSGGQPYAHLNDNGNLVQLAKQLANCKKQYDAVKTEMLELLNK